MKNDWEGKIPREDVAGSFTDVEPDASDVSDGRER